MVLSDRTLKAMMNSGELVVDPLNERAIQGASIDCRLGDEYLTIDENRMTTLSFDSEIIYREVHGDSIVIPPRSFLLGTTMEYVKLPNNLTAFVEGRSSIGRMGLFIQNAGWIDPGFEGRITLELFNANSLPIELKAFRRVCQLVFCSMDHHADQPYRGKYQLQDKPVGSRIYLDGADNP